MFKLLESKIRAFPDKMVVEIYMMLLLLVEGTLF